MLNENILVLVDNYIEIFKIEIIIVFVESEFFLLYFNGMLFLNG